MPDDLDAAGVPAQLAEQVRAFVGEDPDPATRAELEDLLAAGDVAGLFERFAEPLTFGTAGLRGPLGAGPARMNRLVVRRVTTGLAAWLIESGPEAARAGLVVGRDARHGSAAFAADVVEVAAALGVAVHVLPQPLPTPLTAFAVVHLGAAAGVMVTASHNPAQDNGYKVYASDGAQIVPPDDELIARAAAASIPPATGSLPARAGLVHHVDRRALLEAYSDAVSAVLDPSAARALEILYTPVHGVGGEVLPWMLRRNGFGAPHVLEAQGVPDPDFPTAPFPNPEEPGVLDLALAEAGRTGADLVLANDPDADRLAVALPVAKVASGAAGPGSWRVLSGDELGALIGDHLLGSVAARAGAGGRAGRSAQPVVACSIVSSSLLGEMAAAAGVRFVETLTGFKWIARAADTVEGGFLLLGYEEALGYAVSPAVRDKDGLSAALLVAEMAASAKRDGTTLLDRLDALDRRFGVHASAQWSLRLSGPGAAGRLLAAVERLRREPPRELGGLSLLELVDLERGVAGLPPTPGVVLRLGPSGGGGAASGSVPQGATPARPPEAAPAIGSARVTVRPSGTEPKLKAYLEVVTSPPGDGPGSLDASRRAASGVLALLREAVASELAR